MPFAWDLWLAVFISIVIGVLALISIDYFATKFNGEKTVGKCWVSPILSNNKIILFFVFQKTTSVARAVLQIMTIYLSQSVDVMLSQIFKLNLY